MHEFQTVVWMEAPRDVPSKSSRDRPTPVLFGHGRHSLPAGFNSVRARVHSLHCLRARAPNSWAVVAYSVSGRLNRLDCSLELVCQVCWISAFHASLKLCAPCIMYMYILWFVQPLQAPRRLVSIIDRVDRSCETN